MTNSPQLVLERAAGQVVSLDLGVRVVAGPTALDLRAHRASYADPIVAERTTSAGTTALRSGLVQDLSGLTGFTHVTLRDDSGAVVLVRDQSFCPNSEASPVGRDAPETSPFPTRCTTNPFALGAVWGLPSGWSASAADPAAEPFTLPDGTYSAQIVIARAYQDFFDIPPEASAVSVGLTVRTVARSGPQHHESTAATIDLHPHESRPTGPATTASDGPLPDLRPLPAGAMTIITSAAPGTSDARRDYLSFFATVWNAGLAPVVVDGFAGTNNDTMDAFQYFYTADGHETGHAPAGSMEWDTRDGHNHWHLARFARYELLDSAQAVVVRSQKEGFCLAANDPIDLTVPGAVWQPANTDLRIGCGGHDLPAIRQRLDVGHGDTYQQTLPGQSFDVTDLPNGTYLVRVIANPEQVLAETDLDNNTSLREVVLGGHRGARTVSVPNHQLVADP